MIFRLAVALPVVLSLCTVYSLAHADDTPCTNSSRYGSQCAPWTNCSVHTGQCQSGHAPLDVCTGYCERGGITRFVPSVRAFAAPGLDTELGGTFGLEIVPRLVGRYLSVRGGWWTNNRWHAGPIVSFPLASSLLLGVAIEGIYSGNGWDAAGALRLDYSPFELLYGFIPAQIVSFAVEAGAIVDEGFGQAPSPYATLGLRVWL